MVARITSIKKVLPVDNNNNNNKDADSISGYVVASICDPTDFNDVYETELNPIQYSKLYTNTKLSKNNIKGKWEEVFGAEAKNKRSRFYKNYQKLMQQSSSGIEQVLEQISNTGGTSQSVYQSAISEKELKEKFKNAVFTEDPYLPEQKLAMHEAINGDGAVKRALSFWRKFLFGKEILVEFEPRKQLDDEVQSDIVTQRMSHHADVIKYRNRLRDIDDEVKLRQTLQANCDNLFGFGRCCFVKLENDAGYPVRLVPLSSYKLGKVWIDALTFEFIGVEYTEIKSEENKNILLASDIVYITLNDNNVSPNTRYYGNSLIFPILSISETNRINRERNFPEIIRKKWAATLVIKTSTKNPAKNQQIVDMVNNRAAGTVAIPDLISAENIKTDTELPGLIQYSIETDKKIFRDMELTIGASGLGEAFQTRSAAQSELNVWAESTLEDLRENITDMLREQWYYPNLNKIVEEDVVANGVETTFELPASETTTTTTTTPDQPSTTPDTTMPMMMEVPPAPDLQTAQSDQLPTKEENLTLLEKLGFDLNSLQQITEQVKNIDPDSLRDMVMTKIANIYLDIYQEITEIVVEDIVSLSDEVKFPWKVFLKFKNIIFDNFLDRAAGVIGIVKEGIVTKEIALELLKLEQYKRKMQEEEMRKEQSRLKQMEDELATARGELLAAQNGNSNANQNPFGNSNGNGNGNTNTENVNDSQNQQDGGGNGNGNTTGTTNISSAINRKIGSRTSRGRVGA